MHRETKDAYISCIQMLLCKRNNDLHHNIKNRQITLGLIKQLIEC